MESGKTTQDFTEMVFSGNEEAALPGTGWIWGWGMGFNHLRVILAENPVFPHGLWSGWELGGQWGCAGFPFGIKHQEQAKSGNVEPPEAPNPSSSSAECTFCPGKWAGNGGKSAIPGLLTNPAPGMGASLGIPDAIGPDDAAVLLVFVFVLLPCVPVAGARKRGEEDPKGRKSSPTAAEFPPEEGIALKMRENTTKKLRFC